MAELTTIKRLINENSGYGRAGPFAGAEGGYRSMGSEVIWRH